MKYFKDCTSLEEVKALYKTLAKQHHPDKGGQVETMQEINREYSFACAKIAKGADLNQDEMDAAILSAEQYRQAVEKIINLDGITIELVGAWIWVTGNTYQHRDVLKEAAFYWAPRKCAWYFRTAEYKVNTRGKKLSLDEIKTKYGSQTITGSFKPEKRLQ